ncbi:hydantoinase B/oxoprolinase family protein [Luteolibacter flavescens]|uniref:Hydantoinase B/oxoprolinase family protein n=1 Tax=Luteolibacter flavescens TaxID=1859460 RepID=A0ABT3FQH0_9BACT|nr:hydantoinase B/oxoprolinase family protein [Luteolibacter flavescens]MCW1885825.1 hydantoinase B/oxoprolinase family protein [Luteolibacter flavescens]
MQWRIRVDTGGTFTDAWAVGPDGGERRAKILSDGTLRCRLVAQDGEWWLTDSELSLSDGTLAGWSGASVSVLDSRDGARRLKLEGSTTDLVAGGILELSCGDEAPVAAARLLTGTPAVVPLPPVDFRVATTRGTNALLERKGAPVLFIVTRGFGDLLEIRDQRRELLFSLAQPQRRPLASAVCECGGRLDASGNEIEALDPEEIREAVKAARAQGIATAAVALLHSWANPEHERRIGTMLREEGFTHVCLSSEVAPMIRLLPRAETAVTDAYLAPVMDHFVRRVAGPLGAEPWLMTSAGGLVPASDFRPKDSLLSGPAGGLVGAAELARRAGFPRVLTFDMGGTSTDVARIDGPFTWRQEQEIGAARVFAPALKIETVAAGGGSICQWRNGRLEVGPESAGANPGPACYGRGGPLTLTDVNLLLGLKDPAKAGIPLDRAAAELRLDELLSELRGSGETMDADGLLAGLRDIAVETMAEAIRGVSVREGCDPQDFALLAFGGAGPQHACAVADRLGVSRVLIPADAGLLSAWGLERARRQEQRVKQILKPLDQVPSLMEEWHALAATVCIPDADFRWIADLRLVGQDTFLTVEPATADSSAAEIIGDFEGEYRKLYGYPPPAGRPVELVALRVAAEEKSGESSAETFSDDLQPGPLLLQDRFSTCAIPAGWGMRRGDHGTLLLEKSHGEDLPSIGQSLSSAVSAGLFRSRFEGIVTSMGEMLRRTALSTNVKERLDYSCALLDGSGHLVASAPHVPVHLGALGVCVREVLRVIDPGPGDVVITNHPGFGGSHLPDVTLIAPVFDAAGERIAFVANRAHHAEIGGKAPGSMPADARCLAEEGVVIAPRFLVKGGETRFDEIGTLLRDAPWPSRRISDNLADLEAQLASIHHGVRSLEDLASAHAGNVVRDELRGILDRSATLMSERLQGLSLDRTVTSAYDDGTPLQLRITADKGKLVLDFTGTGDVHPRNLNATPAIVRSAVLFALRLWLGEDVPLNEGLLEAVETIIPRGILSPDFGDDPAKAPAVVGGNVETSQRLTELLLEALDLAANGPGTMNNFLFGDERFGYYETLAGGSGAGPGHVGNSGRHVHMTNTAITDPEVMEHRFPVRLWRYEVRRDSGGHGKNRGGDGVIREVQFLKPLVISFLTERRVAGPRGIHGGSDGSPGSQVRIHPDGSRESLPGAVTYQAAAGERVVIETPGGGGFGEA